MCISPGIFVFFTIVLVLDSCTSYGADRLDRDAVQGFFGVTGQDLYPGNCDRTTTTKSTAEKSGEQVKVEFFTAQRSGEIVVAQDKTTVNSPTARLRRQLVPAVSPAIKSRTNCSLPSAIRKFGRVSLADASGI